MPRATILVFEQYSRWVPELRRQFVKEDVRVRGCSTVSEIPTRASPGPARLIVLTLDAAPAACLQFLGSRRFDEGRTPVVVLGSDEWADLEWPVRELGAADFLRIDRPGHEVAAICRRHWQPSTNVTEAKATTDP